MSGSMLGGGSIGLRPCQPGVRRRFDHHDWRRVHPLRMGCHRCMHRGYGGGIALLRRVSSMTAVRATMSRHPARLYLLVLAGIIGVSALMAIREGTTGVALRALLAGLAALLGSSAFWAARGVMRRR